MEKWESPVPEYGASEGISPERCRQALVMLLILKNLPGVGKRTINRYCMEPLRKLLENGLPENEIGQDHPASNRDDSKCKITPCSSPGSSAFFRRRESDDIGQRLSAEIMEWLKPAGVQPAGPDFEAAEAAAGRLLDWLSAHTDAEALTPLDAAYPEKLRDLGAEQPPVLYVRRGALAAPVAERCGHTDTSEQSSLHNALSGVSEAPAAGHPDSSDTGKMLFADSTAVIGSRWPEDRTFRESPELIESLVRETGTVIISGLARGCDAVGHRAAIAAGGITGAVLASGIDIITPSMHTGLAEEILRSGGFLMSEYDPGTEPAEFRYVERDRLTAAMADRILVLECGIRSGTMQTVKAGAFLGRPAGCVCPADGSEAAEGNRYMLEHYDASPIRSTADLLRWKASSGQAAGEGGNRHTDSEKAGPDARSAFPKTEQLTMML